MIHREQDIIDWGVARNILGATGCATKSGQNEKTYEEICELQDAIKQEREEPETARTNARDAIGDIIVTLIMQAQMWNLTIEECIEAAWNEIKDRKGRMVGGVFVKEPTVIREWDGKS